MRTDNNTLNSVRVNNGYIVLRGLHLYAFHGVDPQEREIGNEYTINLKCKVDFSIPARTDKLSDTVNYAEIFQVIQQEMRMPCNLLEHMAWKIASKLLNRFNAIQTIELSIDKRNPPIGADIESAGVELHLNR